MGNHRFRLSDMIPNAWFYKLRDMSKTRKPNSNKKLQPFPSQNPNNYKSTESKILTSFDPPRKSLKKWDKRRAVYVPSPRKISPSVSGSCKVFQEPVKPENVHFHACFDSPDNVPASLHQGFLDSSLSGFPGSDSSISPRACKLTSSATDIISESDFNVLSEPKLPPIQTRPKTLNSRENRNRSPKVKNTPENILPSKKTRTPGGRKSFSRSGRVRIRAKGTGKKSEARARKSFKEERKEMFSTERFAIVKASVDPERDFRESMMEMIVENNIRASKELEDLLACYLSLNSNQYHDIIVKAFEQIWFNLAQSLS